MAILKQGQAEASVETPDSGYIRLFLNSATGAYGFKDSSGTFHYFSEGITREEVEDLLQNSFNNSDNIEWVYDDSNNYFTADLSAATLNLINGAAQFSTGVQEGAQLSVGGATGTFSISAGKGVVVDAVTDVLNPIRTQVNITAKTDVVVTNILTQNVTYITIDKFDQVQQYTTLPNAQKKREEIYIGVVVHSDHVNVNVVNNLPVVALDVPAQLTDFLDAVGFMKSTGNLIKANGANLSIDKETGTVFRSGVNFQNNNLNPNTITLAAQSPVTFRYRNQNGDEDTNDTTLNPTEWDNNGTTSTVPLNTDATIQKVFMFPSGAIRIQRGQEVFSSLGDAVDYLGDEDFTVESNIGENGILLCGICITKDATDLTDRNKALIFQADKFGQLTSVASKSATNYQDLFSSVTVDTGDTITVDSQTTALDFTSSDGSIGISGDNTGKSIDLTIGSPTGVPAVSVTKTADLALTTTNQLILFDQEDVENIPAQLEHDNTNTERLYLHYSGHYFGTFAFAVDNTANAERVATLDLYLNGSTLLKTLTFNISKASKELVTRAIVLPPLAAGSYLDMRMRASTNGDLTLKGNSVFNIFSLRGVQGEQGPQGPQGTLSIQEVYDDIAFVEVDLPTDHTQSTTTLTTAFTHTTATLDADSKYEVECHFQAQGTNYQVYAEIQFHVDGTALPISMYQPLQPDAGPNASQQDVRFMKGVLTTGVTPATHTLELVVAHHGAGSTVYEHCKFFYKKIGTV